jgi:hypothetical protein
MAGTSASPCIVWFREQRMQALGDPPKPLPPPTSLCPVPDIAGDTLEQPIIDHRAGRECALKASATLRPVQVHGFSLTLR